MSLDLDLTFPIRDVQSADLMMLKATCLWNAGIIDDRQRELVHQWAERFLRRDLAVTPSWPSAGSSLAASPHAA
jgi:hypothetical protein